jgi:hypothetical protein
MNRDKLLCLKVWKSGNECLFLLENYHSISTRIEYNISLDNCYKKWYEHFLIYEGCQPTIETQETQNFDKWNPNSVNPQLEPRIINRLTTELLHMFHEWLSHPNLLVIRTKIREEVKINTVNLLIACDDLQLIKFPWETWSNQLLDQKAHRLKISRTLIDSPAECISKRVRQGKKRFLVIIGYASDLDTNKDQECLDNFEKNTGTKVKFFRTSEKSIDDMNQELLDDYGWDGLVFLGHSEEDSPAGGLIKIGSNNWLEISDIKSSLITAKERGLKIAILNSCNGISIAQSLIDMGLSQVLIMKEKISDRLAHVFLECLCKHLKDYYNIQTALQKTCEFLQQEKLVYPAAYTLPLLFYHPDIDNKPFQVQKPYLQELVATWRPTYLEALILGVCIFLSSLGIIQELTFDIRGYVQAWYRQQTKQIPASTTPPVLLIGIDLDSIERATERIPDFQTQPIERQYLAELVNHLALFPAKNVGINYKLYSAGPRGKSLASALKKSVQNNQTWFVLGVEGDRRVGSSLASDRWILKGNTEFTPWEMELPTRSNLSCEATCPFAYLLFLSSYLKELAPVQPQLINKLPLSLKLHKFLVENPAVITPLKKVFPPWGMRSVLDFSLPRTSIYQSLTAEEFLSRNVSQLPNLEEQVVIIASQGYEEAQDKFYQPSGVSYWCGELRQPCLSHFTGGEVNAYMVYHFLRGHRLFEVPDLWMILLAGFCAKATSLYLRLQPAKNRQELRIMFLTLPVLYGIVLIQAYLTVSLLIPWLFPSLTYWIYLFNLRRQKL